MAIDNATQLFIQAYQWLSQVSTIDIKPPVGYKGQVEECRKIIKGDVTGVVSTVIEFMINAVKEVTFRIETDNPELNKILNQWLRSINRDLRKHIKSGFNAFSTEFAMEYFQSGMSIVKYEMEMFKGIKVPHYLWVLDSSNITVEGKEGNINEFKYKINGKDIVGNYLVRKDGRWYEKYPVPFLIRRGIYSNYTMKQKLKVESSKILRKLLWYLLMIKKGDPNNPSLVYTETEIDNVLNNLKSALQDNEDSMYPQKTPAWGTSYDTQLEHVLPDLAKIFNKGIYEEIDRDILAGLGLIEIVEGLGSTRREAILNPKPLIQQVITLVLEIEQLIYELIYDIVEVNVSEHRKYFSDLSKIRVVATPVKAFWTDNFKKFVRSFYDRGLISKKSVIESLGFDFITELKRRENEIKEAYDVTLYPPIIKNQEKDETNLEALRIEEKDNDKEENITEDKEGIEKENFDNSSEKEEDKELEGSPYKNVKSLPKNVKKSMTVDLQRVWMKVFNKTYDTYDNYEDKARELIAIKTAWKIIRQIGRKNKKGKWVRKRKREDGKLKGLRVTNEIMEKSASKAEQEVIKISLDEINFEINQHKAKVLKHLADRIEDKKE